jgi:hypothetical protein
MISDICLMSDLFIYDRALFVEKVNKQQRKLRKKQLSSSLKKSDIRHHKSDIIHQTYFVYQKTDPISTQLEFPPYDFLYQAFQLF